jgi:hypothetical protein
MAGGWMQALGVDPARVGIDPKTPMTMQAVNAIVSDLVIGKLGSGGFPTNNFSNTDRDFLKSGIFEASDTPEANHLKLEVLKRAAEVDERKAAEWSAYRQAAKKAGKEASYEDFEGDFRAKLGNVFEDLPGYPGKSSPGTGGTAPAPNPILDELRRRGIDPAKRSELEDPAAGMA